MSGARAPTTAQTPMAGKLRTHRALSAWIMSELCCWTRGDHLICALSPKIVNPPADRWGRRINNDHVYITRRPAEKCSHFWSFALSSWRHDSHSS
eukprot:2256290-Lingulodinium_polyedra.AAC.1